MSFPTHTHSHSPICDTRCTPTCSSPVLLVGNKRNAITASMTMETDRNVLLSLAASYLMNGHAANMLEKDGCGEAAVYQSVSSFLCVTDAPNDVINHDTAPSAGI